MAELGRKLAATLGDRAERRRLVRFALVGVSNGAVTLAVYLLMIEVGLWYPLAAALGYLTGIANGYTWNTRWTFRTGSFDSGEFLRYFLVAGMGLLANAIGITIAVELLEMQKTLAEVVTLTPIVLASYLANRVWVFRERLESATRGSL